MVKQVVKSMSEKQGVVSSGSQCTVRGTRGQRGPWSHSSRINVAFQLLNNGVLLYGRTLELLCPHVAVNRGGSLK